MPKQEESVEDRLLVMVPVESASETMELYQTFKATSGGRSDFIVAANDMTEFPKSIRGIPPAETYGESTNALLTAYDGYRLYMWASQHLRFRGKWERSIFEIMDHFDDLAICSFGGIAPTMSRRVFDIIAESRLDPSWGRNELWDWVDVVGNQSRRLFYTPAAEDTLGYQAPPTKLIHPTALLQASVLLRKEGAAQYERGTL